MNLPIALSPSVVVVGDLVQVVAAGWTTRRSRGDGFVVGQVLVGRARLGSRGDDRRGAPRIGGGGRFRRSALRCCTTRGGGGLLRPRRLGRLRSRRFCTRGAFLLRRRRLSFVLGFERAADLARGFRLGLNRCFLDWLSFRDRARLILAIVPAGFAVVGGPLEVRVVGVGQFSGGCERRVIVAIQLRALGQAFQRAALPASLAFAFAPAAMTPASPPATPATTALLVARAPLLGPRSIDLLVPRAGDLVLVAIVGHRGGGGNLRRLRAPLASLPRLL